jgi:hypothetical protein
MNFQFCQIAGPIQFFSLAPYPAGKIRRPTHLCVFLRFDIRASIFYGLVWNMTEKAAMKMISDLILYFNPIYDCPAAIRCAVQVNDVR